MKKIVIFSVLLIILTSIMIVPKQLQNDTFYLIKSGESLIKNGLDFMDHFSFHELTYLYPHLIFCIIAFFSYKLFSFGGIYILTIFYTIVLGLTLYYVNNKNSKNKIITLVFSLFTMLLLIDFITLRSQIISYTIFILEFYLIDKLRNVQNKKYCLALFLLAVLLVNSHVAVYPFYIILYLPFLGEYIYNKIFKKTNFKIKLIVISLILSILSGLFSHLFINSYTYLFYTLINDTTQYISEHQPTILIHSPQTILMCLLCCFLFNNKYFKIKINEMFLLLGTLIMAFSSLRHQSLFIIFTMIIANKYIGNYLYKKEFTQNNLLEKKIITKKGIIIANIIILVIFLPIFLKNQKLDYVNKNLYPVEIVKYINNNLDYKNIKIFNDINIGSYLIMNNIPVFIDSRTDLYTKIYNGKEDIYKDYINVIKGNIYYEEIFEKYNINYILIEKDSWLSNYIKKDKKYTVEYEDSNFVLFKYICI